MSTKISMARGDSRRVDVTISLSTGGLLNLANVASSSLTVKRRVQDTSPLFAIAGVIKNSPGTDGVMSFSIAPADTSAIDAGLCVYDVRLAMIDGAVYTVARGVLDLAENISA